MSDDLTAFFAKKKAKGAKKKAIRLEEVGQQLAEARIVQEEEPKPVPKPEPLKGDSDSEWIDYDSKPLRIVGETVKTFNASEFFDKDEESEHSETDAVREDKKPTWNKPTEKTTEDVKENKETVVPSVTIAPSKFQAYRPPSQRTGPYQSASRKANVDIKNEEMFPSLGAADKIVKQQTEDAKKQKEEAKEQQQHEEQRRADIEQRRADREARKLELEAQRAKEEEERQQQQQQQQQERQRPVLAPPAPRPTVQPPSGDIGSGIMNARGEWIKLPPEPPASKPEPRKEPQMSWRRNDEQRKAEAAEAPAAPRAADVRPKANPFGAAKPKDIKYPPITSDNQSQPSWRKPAADQQTQPQQQQQHQAYRPPGSRRADEDRDRRDTRGPRRDDQSSKWRSAETRHSDWRSKPAPAAQAGSDAAPSPSSKPDGEEDGEEGWSRPTTRGMKAR